MPATIDTLHRYVRKIADRDNQVVAFASAYYSGYSREWSVTCHLGATKVEARAALLEEAVYEATRAVDARWPSPEALAQTLGVTHAAE